MPQRYSTSTVQEIVRLAEANKSSAEIAQKLNVPRMEVAAILAHSKKASLDSGDSSFERGGTSRTSVPVEPEPVPESWNKSMAEPEELPAGFFLGDDAEFDSPITWDPTDSSRVSNPHLMIMGESGSGKTYAAQGLIAEIAQQGIPTIVFDYGQSFELGSLDKVFLEHARPKEHLIGEEGLAFNPLEIFAKDVKGPNQVATRLADVFDAGFALGDIQKKVLIDAAIKVYRDAGITQNDPKTWKKAPPSINALQTAIDELSADKDYPNKKNAASLSARLTTFFMLASFRQDKWSWDAITDNEAERVHVLQFRGLEGKTQRVLVEVLLWHLFFHLKSHGQNTLRVFLVLDEAHHLSFRESGPLNNLLREARKFGLGVIFASQQPEDFTPVAYSNSASKLVFQTSDANLKVSKFLTGKADNFNRPEDIRDAMSSLPRGQALFITQNRGARVKIASFPQRAALWQRR